MSEAAAVPLSPLAQTILSTNPQAYRKLVVTGSAPAETRTLLDGVRPEQLINGKIAHVPNAWAALAALWLWHDGLDECHRIVQKSPGELLNEGKKQSRLSQFEPASEADLTPQQLRDATRTYSFWHAIMHRREGDFSNSKYWYAKAFGHPVMTVLAHQAGAIVNQLPADRQLLKLVATGWDPDALVDLAESVHDQPTNPKYQAAIALQQMEWRALFEFCTR